MTTTESSHRVLPMLGGAMQAHGEIIQVDVSGASIKRGPRDECGVCGIVVGDKTAALVKKANLGAILTSKGIETLKDRGDDSSGMAVSQNGKMLIETGAETYVADMTPEDLKRFPGRIVSAHTRYATTGCSKSLKNAQPLHALCRIDGKEVDLALSHNGNLVNTEKLRSALSEKGVDVAASSDSALIAALAGYLSHKKEYKSEIELVSDVVSKLQGAYSLLFHFPETLIAARDPHGVRPLCIGRIEDSIIFTSESYALEKMHYPGLPPAEFVRDVAPGEIVSIGKHGDLQSVGQTISAADAQFCSLEFVYFLQDNTVIAGKTAGEWRKLLGRQVADELVLADIMKDADFVSGVPKSGVLGSLGLFEGLAAHGRKVEYKEIFKLNQKFIDERNGRRRSFTQSNPEKRAEIGSKKLLINDEIVDEVKGKKLILFDDSLVRGTSIKYALEQLKELDLAEIHLVLGYPKVKHTCFYGIDISDEINLICNRFPNNEDLAQFLGVTSVTFLSPEGIKRVANENGVGICGSCFTGRYDMATPMTASDVILP